MRSGRQKKVRILLPILLGLCLAGQAEEVLFTGNPASTEYMKAKLMEAGHKVFPPKPLRPGQSWKRGDLTVINLDWHPPASSLTALSDHPEKVDRAGGLFFGGLSELRPLNFQYYHLGKLQGPSPNLALYLSNPGSTPATLHWREGVGRPSLDYFSTGHTNNTAWFQSELQNLGSVVTIPPGQTVKLFTQPMPAEYVVSGTLGLTLMEGPPVQFALVARRSSEETPSFNDQLKADDVHSRGFYPAAVQRIVRTYRIGQQPLNLAVGAVRQQTFSGVRELRGDYGVTYELDLTLHNPSTQATPVNFFFNPRGGPATATFLIDDRIVEVGLTKEFKETPFHQVELAPGETRPIRLRTIPEGASSYPIRIIVK